MLWRIATALIIILAGMNLSQTEASPRPSGGPASIRQNGFENDNNLVDTLFQNFNGNESSDGGRKKKATIGPLPAPVSAPAEVTSATEAYGRARVGRETTVALANDRVVVRVPVGLTDDLEVSIKVVGSSAGTPPGPVIGGLVFRVGAQPFGAGPLDLLPIEANLSARYTDGELGSRDESKLMLSWLDPADNAWKPAPKPAADARNNYLSATIRNLGVYAVHQAP